MGAKITSGFFTHTALSCCALVGRPHSPTPRLRPRCVHLLLRNRLVLPNPELVCFLRYLLVTMSIGAAPAEEDLQDLYNQVWSYYASTDTDAQETTPVSSTGGNPARHTNGDVSDLYGAYAAPDSADGGSTSSATVSFPQPSLAPAPAPAPNTSPSTCALALSNVPV
jgi:hypothetical protein